MGGAVQSFSSPMLAQGMQGGLSGFGTSGLQTFADGGQTTTIQDILAKYKAMESAKPKQDPTTEFLNKSWEGKNIDDYVMYSDKYKRGGKMAKGGIFEHGLQEGDKIVKQVDDKYLIVASKGGVYSVVDIEKGSRFIVGLDDSKTSGKRKSVKAGVKEAMEYINYLKSTKMANGGKFAQGGMLEDAKIYVADLAEYNNGRLVGKWLDLSDYSSGAEVMEAIQEMLDEQTKKDKYGDVHEEYAIHDFEGFPRSFYSESMGESDFDELYEIAKIADSSNLPIDVLMEAVSDLGYEDDPERVAEAYYSSVPASMGNEWRDFAYEYIDSIGNITEAVSKPEYYFDFENFGSDIRMDYTDEELEEMGYNDLSDEELGEQMADEMGGVKNLGEKLIETYFDYDKFGRELEYDFIAVRGKDGDYYFFNRNFAKGGKVKIKNFRKIESKGKTPKVPQEKWKVMVVSPYAKKDEAVYFNVSAKNKEEAEKLAKSLYSKKYNVPTTKLLIETALPYSHLNRFQIKNQYEGKTPKEIWNAMSLSQKEHFLKDHRVVCEVNFDEIKELYWLNWDELNDSPMKNNVVQAFTEHINEGQYAKGGEVDESNMDIQFIEYGDYEIMYEPHYKKYYANDVEFDSLEKAKKFLDSGAVSSHIKGAYDRGLFAKGGEVSSQKIYEVEYEIGGKKYTSEYMLYENDRVEKMLPPTAQIISIKEKHSEGGEVVQLPPKGELTNRDNLLLKYQKVGSNYEFYIYEPIVKKVSEYNQTKYVCKNSDCALKMNYKEFINYLYSELYLDDKKFAKGGTIDKEFPIGYIVVMQERFEDYKKAENILKKHGIQIDASKDFHTKGFADELYGEFNDGVKTCALKFDINDAPNPQALVKELYAFEKKNLPKVSIQFGKYYAKGGKIGFEGLAKKVGKRYVGKKVSKEYQAEYGKTYDAKEAKEVGNKVAGKVYKQQVAKKKIVRKLQRKTK